MKELIISDANETALMLVRLAIEAYIKRNKWLYSWLPYYKARMRFLHRTLIVTEKNDDDTVRTVIVKGVYITRDGRKDFSMGVIIGREGDHWRILNSHTYNLSVGVGEKSITVEYGYIGTPEYLPMPTSVKVVGSNLC